MTERQYRYRSANSDINFPGLGKGAGKADTSLSAWGPGPWSTRRGFDSLVQTATGINAAEAAAAAAAGAQAEVARPLPCQALDHGAGYLLAAGVIAAMYHRQAAGGRSAAPAGAEDGNGDGGVNGNAGAWDVEVSLEGVMAWLKALGRRELDLTAPTAPTVETAAEWLKSRDSGLGVLTGVTFPGVIEGAEVGWERMPGVRGSDIAEWL